VVRIGRPDTVRAELAQYLIDEIVDKEVGPMAELKLRFQAEDKVIRDADVVCCTCSGSGADRMERFKFTCVLLDEASQITEPSTLIPLTHGARQVCLVGDHKQLPPTTVSREAGEAGLGTSLFDRMISRGMTPEMLTIQYRMHPTINEYSSRTFYEGFVKSGVTAADRPLIKGFDWPNPDKPIAFVEVNDSRDRKEGTSFYNEDEVDKMVEIISAMVESGDITPKDIGVVTPYAAQVQKLRRALKVDRQRPGVTTSWSGKEQVEISSVDGFQGREKELIVFSAVRANTSGNVGFLADPRRINVMLTRAKRGLIVIANRKTLEAETTIWAPWCDWLVEEGICEKMPDEEEEPEDDNADDFGGDPFGADAANDFDAAAGGDWGAGESVNTGGGGW